MNCKPGDLAFVINEDPGLEMNIGRIVKVLGRASRPKWGDWEVEPTSDDFLIYMPSRKKVMPFSAVNWGWIVMADKDLRPIRPDGITTEEVKELFSPSPAKESEKV